MQAPTDADIYRLALDCPLLFQCLLAGENGLLPGFDAAVRSALVGLVAQNKQLSEALLRLQLAVQYPTAETHHPDCRA